MPLRRFLGRMHLKRYEYNLLMGICRQVQWMSERSSGSLSGNGS
jgi:tRNA/rRNA methyltransferase